MANRFGYSGSLGYNSTRISRSGNCCCPPKGDKGDIGEKGFYGEKGDKGDDGVKGDSGVSTLHGLFIYSDYLVAPQTLSLDIDETATPVIGDPNLNFVNENPITNNTLICFSDLSNNYNNGIVEFYLDSEINPNNANSPVYTFDLSGIYVETGSKSLIELDTRSTGKTSQSHNVAFGPISYKLSSDINSEIIHFNNTYKLRTTIVTNSTNQHEINNTRLMVKFRQTNPINV